MEFTNQIEDRGLGLAAIFKYPGHGFHELNREVVLCEEPLLMRIENLERLGLPTGEEHVALTELRRQKKALTG